MKKFLLSTAFFAFLIAGAQAQKQVKKTEKQPEPAATEQKATTADPVQPSGNLGATSTQQDPNVVEKAAPAVDTANKAIK